MRKDDEVEEVPAGGTDRVAAQAIYDEPELTDDELLGAATLAKIGGKPVAVEDAEPGVDAEEQA